MKTWLFVIALVLALMRVFDFLFGDDAGDEL